MSTTGAVNLSTLSEFYAGRSVLVTGHTGFKGAWLSLWLTALGARVHGFALPAASGPSLFEEAGLAGRLASHRLADIRDASSLAATVHDVNPEVVFHLAAQALVRRSHREPRETFEVNVMGTVNLLEALRATKRVARRVCQVITSDKCYENHGWPYAYRENDAMGGADPYSASKGCAELVVSAYRESFFSPTKINEHGLSLSSSRAGNVIGGGDWAEDRIIPDCVRSLSRGEPVPVRNPSAVRPWQHVLEPLAGYLLLAAKQWTDPAKFAEGWNFGPSPSGMVTVGKVAELAVQSWGSGSWADRSEPNQLHEAHVLRLDMTKAATQLGWRPVFSVQEAVAETISWYRRRAAEKTFDAREACLAQIRGYESRAKETQPA